MIDVVIPTYNQTTLLLKAINSCKQQTYQLNRIWVIDDGSNPEVVAWLEEHFDSDEQVEIVLMEHTGLPGAARDLGLAKSTAEWIAFLDADDFWHAEKIERQVEVIISKKAKFVYTNAMSVFESDETEALFESLPKLLKFRELVRTNWIVNSSVLVRRDFLVETTGYAKSSRVRAVEDFATWLRAASFINLYGLDLPLTYYRVSDSSIRQNDTQDPRIHAFADYLIWLKTHNGQMVNGIGKRRKIIIRMIERQYGH